LYLYGRTPPDPFPSASLLDNKLRGNYGSRTADGWGGGIQASYYRIELMDNLVQYNTAGTAKEGKGGGLYIFFSDALLEDNVIRYNIANLGVGTPEQRSDEEEDEMPEGMSGGVHFCTCGDVRLENNAIYGNIACLSGNGYGGGVSFCKTTATLDSNKIISNTATLSTTGEVKGWGGGVWTGDNASVSFSNDLIAGNHAKTQGAGLWFGVENEAYNDRGIRLQHVTISDNTGPYLGHGVYVTHAIAFLTNTIMANHSIGIYVSGVGSPEYRGAATLEATLWYANDVNATGGGTIKLGIHNYNGDPAFVDPGNWDYHIGPDSPAIDRGVQTGVRTDMDGERRPWLAPDLGADEVWPPGAAVRAYLPLILRQSSGE
jgi:hypothetical protein